MRQVGGPELRVAIIVKGGDLCSEARRDFPAKRAAGGEIERRNGTMQVRALVADDFPRWSELWDGYLRFYETELPPDVSVETFRRLLSEDVPNIVALGAFAPALVGIAHLVFHPSTWRLENDCYLEDLFVDPSARRSGAGSLLLEECKALAKLRGADRLYWLTKESNSVARALYDQVAVLSPFVVYETSP
jgi:GNAT superfamily N-acetyltransferase